MEQNLDLDTIRYYSESIKINVVNDLISYFQFAPLTSPDVEKLFLNI